MSWIFSSLVEDPRTIPYYLFSLQPSPRRQFQPATKSNYINSLKNQFCRSTGKSLKEQARFFHIFKI
ncbi:MAG TPA: hypothetical protein DGB85_12070 [Deltaproteobacteria bacterium]|nr:hypothetical protein [Deltaproteobacteria bacterium]